METFEGDSSFETDLLNQPLRGINTRHFPALVLARKHSVAVKTWHFSFDFLLHNGSNVQTSTSTSNLKDE